MSDTTLYTLREISQRLSLPESTVRYYRDAFAPHITTVGTGRRRRYPEDAVAVLRTIAEGYASGLSRDAIERSLTGTAPVEHPARPERASVRTTEAEDLLATVLDGERERREVMWQMAREIVRLGEAIERQHVILGSMSERLDASRTLPPPLDAPDAATESVERAAPPRPMEGLAVSPPLASELQTLREELESERALVERLRRSKLEIERRAAEAEAQLESHGDGDARGGSLLGRLFRRPGSEGGG